MNKQEIQKAQKVLKSAESSTNKFKPRRNFGTTIAKMNEKKSKSSPKIYAKSPNKTVTIRI